jgi:xanthine dehydrogenase accessory factor
MDLSLIETIAREVRGGHRGVLCILIEQEGSTPRKDGASMWVYPDGGTEGTIGGGPMEFACVREAVSMLERGESAKIADFDLAAGLDPAACPEGAVCGGMGRVYLEVIMPDTEIFIFGAGHVSKALARVANAAGYSVIVWDERAEYANEENIPWAKTMTCPLDELFDDTKHPGLFHENTYAIVVTRGHNLDSEVMHRMEKRDAAYIGVIGSRGKIAFVDKQLRDRGVSESYLSRLYRPIGLPIRAETPEEIAICILAEIIAVQRGANVGALREAK